MELKDKVCLTIEEAAEYSNIGQSKLYDVIKRPMCSFVLKVGNKSLNVLRMYESMFSFFIAKTKVYPVGYLILDIQKNIKNF